MSVNNNKSCSCSKDFKCKDNNETNICVPVCGSWKTEPYITSVAVDVVVVLSAIIGVVSAVAVIVIAISRRKKVYVRV